MGNKCLDCGKRIASSRPQMLISERASIAMEEALNYYRKKLLLLEGSVIVEYDSLDSSERENYPSCDLILKGYPRASITSFVEVKYTSNGLFNMTTLELDGLEERKPHYEVFVHCAKTKRNYIFNYINLPPLRVDSRFSLKRFYRQEDEITE